MGKGSIASTPRQFLALDAFIDWSYPAPRTGFWGTVDGIAGPGYTTEEVILPWLMGLSGMLYVACHNLAHQPEWTLIQRFWSGFFALHVGFGVAVSQAPLKRWYHRDGRAILGGDLVTLFCESLSQMVVLNWVFWEELGGNWNYLYAIGAFTVLAFSASALAPLHMKRPVSVALLMIHTFLGLYHLPQIKGMEWYPFVIFVKYLVHLPREEPYRPSLQAKTD